MGDDIGGSEPERTSAVDDAQKKMNEDSNTFSDAFKDVEVKRGADMTDDAYKKNIKDAFIEAAGLDPSSEVIKGTSVDSYFEGLAQDYFDYTEQLKVAQLSNDFPRETDLQKAYELKVKQCASKLALFKGVEAKIGITFDKSFREVNGTREGFFRRSAKGDAPVFRDLKGTMDAAADDINGVYKDVVDRWNEDPANEDNQITDADQEVIKNRLNARKVENRTFIENASKELGFKEPFEDLLNKAEKGGYDITYNVEAGNSVEEAEAGNPGSPSVRIKLEKGGATYTIELDSSEGEGKLKFRDENGEETAGPSDLQEEVKTANDKIDEVADKAKKSGLKEFWDNYGNILSILFLLAAIGMGIFIGMNLLAHHNIQCQWRGLNLNNISSKIPFINYLVNDQYGREDINHAQDNYYNPLDIVSSTTLSGGGANDTVSNCTCGGGDNITNNISRAYAWWFGVDDASNSRSFPSGTSNPGEWIEDFKAWFNATVNIVDKNNGVTFPSGDPTSSMKTTLTQIVSAIQNGKIFSQPKYRSQYGDTIKYLTDNSNQLGAIAATITEYMATLIKDGNNIAIPVTNGQKQPNAWKLDGDDGGDIIYNWQEAICESAYPSATGDWDPTSNPPNNAKTNRVIPACLNYAKDKPLGPGNNSNQINQNKDILNAPGGAQKPAFACFDINVGESVSGGYYKYQQYTVGDLLSDIFNSLSSLFGTLGSIIKLIIIIVACIIGGSIVIWAFVKYAVPQIKKGFASVKEGPGDPGGGGEDNFGFGFNMGRRRNPYMMLK